MTLIRKCTHKVIYTQRGAKKPGAPTPASSLLLLSQLGQGRIPCPSRLSSLTSVRDPQTLLVREHILGFLTSGPGCLLNSPYQLCQLICEQCGSFMHSEWSCLQSHIFAKRIQCVCVCVLNWHSKIDILLMPLQSTAGGHCPGSLHDHFLQTYLVPSLEHTMRGPSEAGTLGPGTLLNFNDPPVQGGSETPGSKMPC